MKQVVIMPGGFHPFHAGHYALYKQAQDAFPGADVYVAATNDTSTRPFPFALKEKLAKLAGVNPGKFIQVKSPFRAMEIVGHLDPTDTQLIFVRSTKDADKPPQAGGVKKDGQPAYLQLLKGQAELAPMAQHAYMAYLPTVEFGPGMTSATEIRTAWPTLNEKRKTALVMSLYPKTQTNPKLAATVVKMLDTAIGSDQDVAEGLDQARVSPKTLQVVQQLRKQLSTPTSLQAKKTMLVIKSDQLGPQDRKLIQDTLAQAGIPFKIKDNQVQSVRGSWTNTLVGIPYDQPGVAEGWNEDYMEEKISR